MRLVYTQLNEMQGTTVSQRDVHFRLTYEREFLPVQNLWRDFLVHSEETGLALSV